MKVFFTPRTRRHKGSRRFFPFFLFLRLCALVSWWLTGLVVVILFPQISASQSLSSWKVIEMKSPAGGSSGESFVTGSGGSFYLSWMERSANGNALKFSKWDGKAWSTPSLIASGKQLFMNWADFPSLNALSDGSLAAHWLEQKPEGHYNYHVMASVSNNQGKTWSTPVSPHKDTSETEHGFVSFLDRGKGNFSVVWLDGRNLKPGEHHGGSGDGAMGLFAAERRNGVFQNEITLDSRVCDCCQTDAAMTQEGPIVVYRDRSEKEIRDISYVRWSDGKWTSSTTLYADNWHIPGCPVNGPAVATSGSRVAVAWFTAAGDQPKVNLVFSNDNGKSFGKPVRLDQGNPSGRVDVAFLSDGSAIACWLENTKDKGAQIRARQILSDGKTGPEFVVAGSSAARSSGFPRMVSMGKEILISWTDSGEQSQVRVARIIPSK